jgi:hypothetical protein
MTKRKLRAENRRYKDALDGIQTIADLALHGDEDGGQTLSIDLTEGMEGIEAISDHALRGDNPREKANQ